MKPASQSPVPARLYFRGRMQLVVLGRSNPEEKEEHGLLMLEDDLEFIRKVHQATISDIGYPMYPDPQKQADLVLKTADKFRLPPPRPAQGEGAGGEGHPRPNDYDNTADLLLEQKERSFHG